MMMPLLGLEEEKLNERHQALINKSTTIVMKDKRRKKELIPRKSDIDREKRV